MACVNQLAIHTFIFSVFFSGFTVKVYGSQYSLDNLDSTVVSAKTGEKIYDKFCVNCHGQAGHGDGRMRKVLNNPPPANLTLTRLTNEQLYDIIANGGQAVGRSMYMPPWRDQLNSQDIIAVSAYIRTLSP